MKDIDRNALPVHESPNDAICSHIKVRILSDCLPVYQS